MEADKTRGKRLGLWGRQLSWGVRGNWFQLQLVDPGHAFNFVIKFHGGLADYLYLEKPGLRRNYKFIVHFRPRVAASELSEDVI
jgi:hypothetical protein